MSYCAEVPKVLMSTPLPHLQTAAHTRLSGIASTPARHCCNVAMLQCCKAEQPMLQAHAKYNTQPATRSVQHAACNTQRATRKTQNAKCNTQNVTCSVQPAKCNMRRACKDGDVQRRQRLADFSDANRQPCKGVVPEYWMGCSIVPTPDPRAYPAPGALAPLRPFPLRPVPHLSIPT